MSRIQENAHLDKMKFVTKWQMVPLFLMPETSFGLSNELIAKSWLLFNAPNQTSLLVQKHL